jgi:hemerythrin-like domain-containing protein
MKPVHETERRNVISQAYSYQRRKSRNISLEEEQLVILHSIRRRVSSGLGEVPKRKKKAHIKVFNYKEEYKPFSK